MNFRKYICLVLAILLLGTTIGCEQSELAMEKENAKEVEENIDENPVNGGQVILPLTKFNTLNPIMIENSSYYYFSKLIFESLFDFDKNLNITNQLAESYNIKDDGRVIEIKLKDGIYWHDGEEFNAEDVAFTINTIKYANTDSTYNDMFKNAIGSFSPSDLRRIMDIVIIDERNIVISFDRSFSNNLEVLTFPIIPSHIFTNGNEKNIGFIKALETNEYTPIGTGPYKFESYEKMKQIKLVANENYRNGKPYIDEIIGRVLDSEEDILTAFETGQINMATTIGVDWEKHSQNKRIRAYEFISSNYEFIGFNFGNELFSGENGQGLRRAIAYGIDRQKIIENLYLGHATQTDVPIHPDSWLISEDAVTYGYNLDLAKKELSDLNLKDTNDDGILEDASGEAITLNLLTNTYNPIRNKTAEMIKEDLKNIGIGVNVFPENNKEDNITKEKIQEQWGEVNEILATGEYDIALLGWQLSVIPDLSFIFHSSQIPYNTNFIKYQNENMDKLLQDSFLTGNREEKINNYADLQKYIVFDLPYFSLFFKNKALLVDSKIEGELEPTFFNPYSGIENCYIPEKLQ